MKSFCPHACQTLKSKGLQLAKVPSVLSGNLPYPGPVDKAGPFYMEVWNDERRRRLVPKLLRFSSLTRQAPSHGALNRLKK